MMNKLVMRGGWHRTIGLLKQRYARVANDDLLLVEGREEELLGRIEQRLGRTGDGEAQHHST
jgi:uncharacterized protein YjbJ (UPF0337 family)